MAGQRVAIKIQLGIEADQLVILGDDQRVDFQHAHITFSEGLIKLAHHFHTLLAQITVEFQRSSDTATDIGLIASGGINLNGEDFFRGIMRHVFDIHAAFR